MAAPAPLDLLSALRGCPQVPIIAEIKRASPSAGALQRGASVERLARAYEEGGAAAISVLTDGPFFQGSLADLEEARRAVPLPILCKDFILDPMQIYESRLAGADAVLLIVAALDSGELRWLYEEALALGLTPLVEVHSHEELARALALNPPIVGINNRDLTTLEVSLETCLRLRDRIPPGVMVVGESGIQGPGDLERLLDGGVDAFLIGTTLMRSPDPVASLRGFCRARRHAWSG